MFDSWMYVFAMKLPVDNVKLGPSLWLINFAGFCALLSYFKNRYYSSQLYNAEFLIALMEDSDDDILSSSSDGDGNTNDEKEQYIQRINTQEDININASLNSEEN